MREGGRGRRRGCGWEGYGGYVSCSDGQRLWRSGGRWLALVAAFECIGHCGLGCFPRQVIGGYVS